MQVEQQPVADHRETAWQLYRFWAGDNDQRRFQQAFIGTYPDLAAFGSELFAEFGGEQHLAALPPWLHPYVQLNPEKFAADLARAGQYYIAEATGGIYVFDAQY